jgi:ElaB/YqjD/DUF883 family membrane-anchored ribosome-binding protein
MSTPEIEKPAVIGEVLNEVSKLKGMLTDAVDDGVRSAVRALKQGRHAAEDAIDDARHVVRKNPFETVGVVFLAGVVTGGLVAWIASRRPRA